MSDNYGFERFGRYTNMKRVGHDRACSINVPVRFRKSGTRWPPCSEIRKMGKKRAEKIGTRAAHDEICAFSGKTHIRPGQKRGYNGQARSLEEESA
jgi:hypothetical protein